MLGINDIAGEDVITDELSIEYGKTWKCLAPGPIAKSDVAAGEDEMSGGRCSAAERSPAKYQRGLVRQQRPKHRT